METKLLGNPVNNITYQVEKYTDCVGELKAIYPGHWAELARDKKQFTLNPDWETYEKLSLAGVINFVTARCGKELIGYHLSFIYPHLHYKQSLTCFTDIFYLKQEYRAGWIGIKLFKFMENTVKERGCERIYMGTKLHLYIGPLLKRLGYNPIEELYTKVL